MEKKLATKIQQVESKNGYIGKTGVQWMISPGESKERMELLKVKRK